ncbi:adenosylmethionine--8-amino-7-oxononanoate transaminase [Leptothoe sp. LEGE 181152]|uniref:Adenosylmethionine-8-amino-7-oxononanoate aminotransferase n=1 Tax=Adonisia turfae CCMR0081 TaxID=2292702 RepID=A0A6M0RXL3_9CYAN|nr:adenosylmethionine--8-amino-7-oxononanoate transaminase [Adonisia turfae]MDV3353373.1 adenosylmethionine--8-amino-7-oxononanoate transaminase [Leptothoe sp. LEGE 181152]NEZ60640.1 adenosylmethionine--8-amino-7-oxononanoate transaminase [Adonisia turfae CCMR0081]
MQSLPTDQLLTIDRQHVWHPYAAMPNPLPIFPVKSAQGVYIELEGGLTLVDGMSSWWTCIHGYNHPRLNQAARDQIDRMSHVMFGGLTHQPAVQLAQRLVELTPEPLQQVFFCDSGSVSVEVAMKMAIQYWYNLGKPEKHRFLTVRGGYHGDTFDAMSVCDPVNGMHHLFSKVLRQQYFADIPQIPFWGLWDDSDIISFEQLLAENHGQIAAAIFEPVVQGAGGMRFYSPDYVRRARELCDQYGVLLILDEIATGFGRTGQLFACEHAKIFPDILCIGKAMSGGFMSLAATLTTPHISQVFSQGEAGVFMHGPTFMANPLACAVALENLAILDSYDWQAKIQTIEAQLKQELAPCRASSLVKDVRVLGAIGVVELHEPVDMAVIQPQVVEHGVWLRPFGKLIYTMPPYIIEPAELSCITQAIVELTR